MHSFGFEDFAFLVSGIQNRRKELHSSQVEHWDPEVLSELNKVTQAVSKTEA